MTKSKENTCILLSDTGGNRLLRFTTRGGEVGIGSFVGVDFAGWLMRDGEKSSLPDHIY
ncbi:MAG: hypothetical protein P8Y63_16095 [Deltaproteobacteria bacterium]